MMDPTISLVYLPTAVALGALHAIEPGHAKTLTAAYLIGIKGTKRDAVLLGLSVAATHSIVVILISALGLWLGETAFADRAVHWLQIGSALIVILLGSWMVWRRWPRHQTFVMMDNGHGPWHPAGHVHGEGHGHEQDDDEAAHIRSHMAAMPDYVKSGERPTPGQIIAFGAAGGMIPCPASITVMLLALSVGKAVMGFVVVLGFSIGLAITLVGIGLAVVVSLNRFGQSSRFEWASKRAPLISAGVVVLSGAIALLLAH